MSTETTQTTGGDADVTTPAELFAKFGMDEDGEEDGGEDAPPPAAAKGDEPADKPAKADAKAKPEKDAKGDKGDDEKADDKPEVDEDLAQIRAINARTRARREAQAAARAAKQAEQAKAAPAAEKPAAEAKPEAKADKEPPLTAAQREVAQATRDVLAQIARLAGDDEEAAAAAAEGDKPEKSKADRNAELAAIKETVEKLAEAAKISDETKGTIEALKAKVEAFEQERFVRQHIESKLEPIADKVPTLAARRDAVDLVHTAAVKFFTKYGKTPDIRELSLRIEKKLAAADEPTETNTAEKKPAPSRKTVSSSLGSPPAARTGPDKRSPREAVADMYARLGIDPHDD